MPWRAHSHSSADSPRRQRVPRSLRHGTVLPSATRHSVRVRIVWTGQPPIDYEPFRQVCLRWPDLTEPALVTEGSASVSTTKNATFPIPSANRGHRDHVPPLCVVTR
jgi:hypothetical protein